MKGFADTGLRPFSDSGYEILDQEFASRGEVVIWSVAPLIPRLGELFLIEHAGDTHEVAVRELTTFKGGWSALCRVHEPRPV